ncbi:hypothetical protein T492DRAFT_848038 [Pavlovales sp. CCMP2436]|nr:hypothetical protein T492DRAFT_848038 [Pavlovales sp. CCMP2436]
MAAKKFGRRAKSGNSGASAKLVNVVVYKYTYKQYFVQTTCTSSSADDLDAPAAAAASKRGAIELAPDMLTGWAPTDPPPFLAETRLAGRAPLAVRVSRVVGGERVAAAVWLSERPILAGDGSWHMRWTGEGAVLSAPPGAPHAGEDALCALVELVALDAGGGGGGGRAMNAQGEGTGASLTHLCTCLHLPPGRCPCPGFLGHTS